MPIRINYGSDSDDQNAAPPTSTRPTGVKPAIKDTPSTMATTSTPSIHHTNYLKHLLGEGKVAHILLWRDKQLSGWILAAATFIWFIFDVVEYTFLTLVCHLSIAVILLLFILFNGAALVDRDPPKIPEVVLSERAFREAAMSFHSKLSKFFSRLEDISCGKDLKSFIITIASLWVVSVIASQYSTLSILYFGFLCIHTLPALYERYQVEVDHLAQKGSHDFKRFYNRLDSKVLNKIPRGPVKNKKYK